MSVIISRPFFLFLLLKVKEKGKEKRKRKEISQFFFSRISLSFVNKFDHPLVSLEGHNQVVIFIKQACPLEIERESNRRKLESFRAIKSDLIFNKFPLHLALRRRGGGWLFAVRGDDHPKRGGGWKQWKEEEGSEGAEER